MLFVVVVHIPAYSELKEAPTASHGCRRAHHKLVFPIAVELRCRSKENPCDINKEDDAGCI